MTFVIADQRGLHRGSAPGDARPRWELAAGLLERLGQPLGVTSAREVFGRVARDVADYAGLDYRAIGSGGRALAGGEGAPETPQEARV